MQVYVCRYTYVLCTCAYVYKHVGMCMYVGMCMLIGWLVVWLVGWLVGR